MEQDHIVSIVLAASVATFDDQVTYTEPSIVPDEPLTCEFVACCPDEAVTCRDEYIVEIPLIGVVDVRVFQLYHI